MLIIFLLIAPTFCQFASYLSLRLRLPGRCKEGDFDCGFGHCVPVRNFHDGRADCMDGSDEWCVMGQVKCGAYCVDFKDSFGCMFNNKCDGSSKQPKFCARTKEKLCMDPQAFPCRGYGECIFWQSLLDGQQDCIDGSDEDLEYVKLLEGPLRCHYNRTQQPQPPFLNYFNHPAHTSSSPPLVPAQSSPLCHRCPPPIVFPAPMPIHPDSGHPSFPTLIPSDSDFPIVPVAGPSSIPPLVQIQHITPTQPEAEYGEWFPEDSTKPPPYPTKIDFTVHAQIKTVFPEISTPSGSTHTGQATTTESSPGWTTDSFAHIKVVPDSERGPSGGQEATHIDLGTGQVVYEGPSTVSSTVATTTAKSATTASSPSTIPHGPVDGLFFIFPVQPVTGRPAAIRPVPPYMFRTVSPIIPQKVTRGPVKIGTPIWNTGMPELISIHPGQGKPTLSGITPKNPFPLDEDYGDFFGRTGPTVKIGVVTPSGFQPPMETTSSLFTTSSEVTSEVGSSSSATTEVTSSPNSTPSSSIASVTMAPVGSEQTKNSSCPSALLDRLKEKYPSPYCECDSDNSIGCAHLNNTVFRVRTEEVCADESKATIDDKARVVLSMVKTGLSYSSCIDSSSDDGIIVSTNCADCLLPVIQRDVDKNNPGPVHLALEALNSSICSIGRLNNCHRNALCIPDTTGIRYHCLCKNGTTDVSNGKGTDCFGWPKEDDCFMIFGICVIFYLTVLLGLLFCCPLTVLLCFGLNKKFRRNTVLPVSATPTTKVKPAITPRTLPPRPPISPGRSAMASILVDALRNNAKGISAVSHSMTTKDRVRFTDEAHYPPTGADWQPLPESHSEPLQSIMKATSTIPRSASDTKLSGSAEKRPASSAVSIGEALAAATATAVETPILEQIRTPIDSTRGTPPVERLSVHSLPIPSIEVPGRTKTSLDDSQIPQSAAFVVKADVHQPDQSHDSHSVVSVGVQPTIWETFRAVGVTGADRGREDSSSSLDDLIGTKFVLSRPVSRVETEEKKSEIPVPKLDLSTETSGVPPAVAEATEITIPDLEKADNEVFTPPSEENLPTPESLARKKSTQSLKLAEMLGVTLDDHNDMQALQDLTSKKIDLPLEPANMTSANLAILEKDILSNKPLERQRTPEMEAVQAAVLKEIVEEEKKREDLKFILPPPEEETANKPVFVPTAARKHSKGDKRPGLLTVPRRRGERGSSTEESDPEVSFAKKIDTLRRGGRDANPFKDRKRRFRRPERQLSSISEKSAEIAADATISEQVSPGDFTVSAPNTTRSLSDWYAFIPRHRRFDAGSTTEDTTDLDIPARFRRKPIVSSPEIPDVTARRSRERFPSLDKAEKSRVIPVKQVPSNHPANPGSEKPKRKSFLPDISRKSTANSRSSIDSKNRASIVSRKIATRKTEMRSSKSASDLTVEQEEIRTQNGRILSKRGKIARSEEYLNKRPPWDISPYREGDDRDERTLPPIHHRSTYSLRADHASSVTKKRLTGSHSTLHTARSGSSINFSPYFDPKHPNKPPKEELWWTPRD